MLVEKAMLLRSPNGISISSSVPLFFSTGTDSPVRADSCIFRFAVSINRRSAGMISPVSSTTISPGTISVEITSSTCPPRNTFEWGELILLSASSDDCAFSSCMVPMIAFTTRIASITKVSTSPSPSITPITAEIMAATSRISTMLLLNCSKKMMYGDFSFVDSSRLGPYSARRSSAVSMESPE